MLHRFVRTLLAAVHLLLSGRKPAVKECPGLVSRAPWDNGINYDIPTYLRRIPH